MKATLTKSLVVLAGVVLVVPFVAVALFVGAQAAAGGGGTDERLVLAALAVGAALFGGVKGLKGGWATAEVQLWRAPRQSREASPTLP